MTRLDEIRARLAACTQVPLQAMLYEHGGGRLCEETGRVLVLDAFAKGDRDFYFAARDDMRYLLDLLDAESTAEVGCSSRTRGPGACSCLGGSGDE